MNMGAIIASQTAMRASTQLMLNKAKKRREREAEERKKKEDKNRK